MRGLSFVRSPMEVSADDVREGDATGGAALGLLGLMTGLSEEHWCAGWTQWIWQGARHRSPTDLASPLVGGMPRLVDMGSRRSIRRP